MLTNTGCTCPERERERERLLCLDGSHVEETLPQLDYGSIYTHTDRVLSLLFAQGLKREGGMEFRKRGINPRLGKSCPAVFGGGAGFLLRGSPLIPYYTHPVAVSLPASAP